MKCVNAGLIVDCCVVGGNGQLVGEGSGMVVDGGGWNNDDDNAGGMMTLIELTKTINFLSSIRCADIKKSRVGLLAI